MEWIEAKVSFDKTMENGFVKRVNEMYLIDAISCTEAEKFITEEMKPYISGEFDVEAVKKSKITEVFFDNCDSSRWYKVKMMYITMDEKTHTEKKTPSYSLVQASDFASALSNFTYEMNGTISDYEIASIVETPIVDVFRIVEE